MNNTQSIILTGFLSAVISFASFDAEGSNSLSQEEQAFRASFMDSSIMPLGHDMESLKSKYSIAQELYPLAKALPVSCESFNIYLWTLAQLVTTTAQLEIKGYFGIETIIKNAEKLFKHPYFTGEKNLKSDLEGRLTVYKGAVDDAVLFFAPIIETLLFVPQSFAALDDLLCINELLSSFMPKANYNNCILNIIDNKGHFDNKKVKTTPHNFLNFLLNSQGRTELSSMEPYEHLLWLKSRDENVYPCEHPLTYEHMTAYIKSEDFVKCDHDISLDFLKSASATAHTLSLHEDKILFLQMLVKRDRSAYAKSAHYINLADSFYKLGKKEEAKAHFIKYFASQRKYLRQVDKKSKSQDMVLDFTPEQICIIIDCLSMGKNNSSSQVLEALHVVVNLFQQGSLKLNDEGQLTIPLKLFMGNRSTNDMYALFFLNREERVAIPRSTSKNQKRGRRAGRGRRSAVPSHSHSSVIDKVKGYNYAMSVVIQERQKEGAGLVSVSQVSHKTIDFIKKLYKNNNFSSEFFEATADEAFILQENIRELGVQLENIDSPSPKTTRLAREFYDQIASASRELGVLETILKGELKALLKNKGVAEASSSSDVFIPAAPLPEHSLRHLVMKNHEKRAKNVRQKTRGIADPDKEESEEEVEEVEEAVNYILTADPNVGRILFENYVMDSYPANTLDCLRILNQSKDIGALRTALHSKLPGSNLKPLTGKKNKGVWQFRINDTYRVRFELNPDGDGFINVSAGDFH